MSVDFDIGSDYLFTMVIRFDQHRKLIFVENSFR